MNFLRLFIFSMLLIPLGAHPSHSQSRQAFGIVFQDLNQNGRYDKADQPLEDILVSNTENIYTTGPNGEFTIPVGNPDIIFVIKPSGYQLPLRDNRVPDFYYLHYPDGSPGALKYPGVAPTGSLPDTLFFPMHAVNTSEGSFKANMVGDPQIPRPKENTFFRKDVVPDLMETNADFSVFLGDIADNNLDIYPHFEQSVKPLDMPLYMIFGNHDVNFRSPDNSLKAETYRAHFGPDYYSFNYGQSHFIVINSVNYFGWNDEEDKRGSYFGGIDPKQLNWIRQDLERVDSDQHVYLLSHIPMHERFFAQKGLKELFEMLEKQDKLTHLSGHTHQFGSWPYDTASYWNGTDDFRGYTLGAACGAWWTGPFGPDSIPDATGNDGTPNGFFAFTFEDGSHEFDFIPASEPRDYQLRISEPTNYVHPDSLANTNLIVNVFTGDERTRVTSQVSDREPVIMEQFTGKDPFVMRNNSRRINRDNWNPGVSETNHLWKSPLPADLKPGTHVIKVKATFPDGDSYTARKIFEVKGR